MPRAKIADAHGLTIELEANEATFDQLGDKALDMLAKAVAIVDRRPVGPAGGVQAERRGEPTMGFGTHWAQPRRWIGTAPAKAEES